MTAKTTPTTSAPPSQRNVSFDATVPEAAHDSSRSTSNTMSFESRAKVQGMLYTITDVPSRLMGLILGAQHLLTMLSASVVIPLIICPPMGATPRQTAEVIATIMTVAGVNTLVQTTIGDRLPIVQGGSFSYLPATFSVIANKSLRDIEDDNERFHSTMQVLSGSLIAVGLIQTFIGYSGLFVPILKYITPVTMAPVITVIGLSLFPAGWSNLSTCFPLGLIQISLTIIFSQYLKKVKVNNYPIFSLFPIVMAIALTWSYAGIMTAADVWDIESQCRTDIGTRELVSEMPWVRIPYPGQWGAPQFKSWGILPMMGGMIAGMIESVGDYYSVAKLSGAPPPTPGIISRGIAGEGLGILTCGCFGAGNGTTSYSENIAAISLTRVGSRSVVQSGAVLMVFMGIASKIAALLRQCPQQLPYINLNSERNLFIVGFSIFNALSIAGPAGYFATQASNPFGTSDLAEIALSIFSSPMIIALVTAIFLDNTIEGNRRDRGMSLWSKVRNADIHNDPEYIRVYGLPRFLAPIFQNCGYLEYCGLGNFPPPPADGVFRSGQGDIGDLCCGGRNRHAMRNEVDGDTCDFDDGGVPTAQEIHARQGNDEEQCLQG